MGWTFKLHGGVAAALGTALSALTALTWLPGTLPLLEQKWLLVASAMLLFPVFITAMVRMFLARAGQHVTGLAFRCLPRKVQAGLAAVLVSGAATMVFGTAGEGHLQSAETQGNRYFVLDTASRPHVRIEVSQSQYQAVLESDQRLMFGVFGVLFIGAAYLVLVAGELNRADRASEPA
ncbi:hypothetical protein [Streptomyces sp. CC208A]|uniref:hypothetical protein n=1 Tax=Streptomyces sp. CC208A TaxID=3044573 RepID=UPI0024A96E8F|nr:hypothetical protein [Streptomyces sp. CC208A]